MGTHAIGQGLISASHLNGEVGEPRALHNSRTGTWLEVHFVNKSLKPVSVSRRIFEFHSNCRGNSNVLKRYTYSTKFYILLSSISILSWSSQIPQETLMDYCFCRLIRCAICFIESLTLHTQGSCWTRFHRSYYCSEYYWYEKASLVGLSRSPAWMHFPLWHSGHVLFAAALRAEKLQLQWAVALTPFFLAIRT